MSEVGSKKRSGRNGGGWLKTGNTVNVGRKPAQVRAEILSTVQEAAGVMRAILDGEFRQEVRNATGKVVCHRPATISEVAVVWKALAQHALALQAQVEFKPEPSEEEGKHWLLLSRADKDLFLELLEKADKIAKGELPPPVEPPPIWERMKTRAKELEAEKASQ